MNIAWKDKVVLWASRTDDFNIICSLEESTRIVYISVFPWNAMKYVPSDGELFHICITEEQYQYFLHPNTSAQQTLIAHHISNKQCLHHSMHNDLCEICKELAIVKVMLS